MSWSMVLLVIAVAANEAFPDEGGPDNTVMRSLRRQTRVTGQPCTCDSRTQSCSCCGMIDEASTSFSARGCGTVRYGARTGKDSRLRYEVSVNDKTVGTRTEVAGTRNPMELCVPAAFLTICTKFFNVEFQNATFTFCFRFDVKYSKFTLLAIDFDCVRASLAPGLNSKVQPPDAGFDPALLPAVSQKTLGAHSFGSANPRRVSPRRTNPPTVVNSCHSYVYAAKVRPAFVATYLLVLAGDRLQKTHGM